MATMTNREELTALGKAIFMMCAADVSLRDTMIEFSDEFDNCREFDVPDAIDMIREGIERDDVIEPAIRDLKIIARALKEVKS
jgi:hypothetical protein